MEQNEIYGALGLEEPAQEPEEETQAQGEQPDQEQPSGEDETESAGSEPEEPAQENEPAQEEETQEDHPPQSKEENARFAAIRRREQESARRQAEELIAGLGLTDAEGNPVTTMEQAAAYREQLRKTQQQQLMDANGWDKGQYETFVGNLPEVRMARDQIARAQMERAKAQLDADLIELQKLDPSVKSLEDLAAKPQQEKLEGYIRKGLNLVEAYTLTYGDELLARQGKAARQAAINDLRSKEHLVPDSKRGNGALEVPSDVMDLYRTLMPDIAEAEAQKSYNEYVKTSKK